jgi:outer membrane protein assembly factor BamB
MPAPARRLFAQLPVLAMAVVIAGCTFVKRKDPRLEGERLPVLVYDTGIKADPELASVPVTVAPPRANSTWNQGSGNAAHAVYHPALAASPRRVFSTRGGEGADEEVRLLAQPIVDAQGRVFVLDVEARITAIDGKSGERLWARDLLVDEDGSGTMGGGLAVADGRLYVTTGFAQLISLDANTGKVFWRQRVSAPFRSGPTVADGKVFAVSADNHTHALDAKSGKVLWTHRGASESASLLGGATPAYESGILVVAYSTGELIGLRATNGAELWNDYLARGVRTSNVGQIADIRASPVIDRGRVIAISNSGRMIAVNLNSGLRIWEQPFGGIQTPWAAGDFIYLLTTDSALLCISRRDGRVRWVRAVPRFKNPKKQEDLITWTGPVLAGDRLIVIGSNRDILAVSPFTGDLLGRERLPDPVSVPPAVARNTLYVFTDDADLIAWR